MEIKRVELVILCKKIITEFNKKASVIDGGFFIVFYLTRNFWKVLV